MANYIRLSHIYENDTPSYGNRDKVTICSNSSIESGKTANSSCWIFSNNHIGTHIDVPKHFNDEGMSTCDIPLNDFFFHSVSLVDIPRNDSFLITIDDFKKLDINPQTDLLLIRTGFEKFRKDDIYWNNNPGLSSDLADYFREMFQNLRCVGFDFISITSWKYREEGCLAHKKFLTPDDKNFILAIEDMSLANVNLKLKKVIVLPIYVKDGNGGPVTVIAEY